MLHSTSSRPPIHTLAVELTDWTLDRTANFPRNQRFILGQRLDNLCLFTLEEITRARFATTNEARVTHLDEINLTLELLRVFWRLAEQKNWISGRQCLFVNEKINEIGRMTGSWKKSLR